MKIAKTATHSAPKTFPGKRPSSQAVVKVRNPNNGTDSRKLTIGKIIRLAVLYLTASIPKMKEKRKDQIIPTIIRNIVRTEKYQRFETDKKSWEDLAVAKESSDGRIWIGRFILTKEKMRIKEKSATISRRVRFPMLFESTAFFCGVARKNFNTKTS